ncbi:MAG TPA: MerR family transcriptional regulator [Acidimicrobiaceae bacterium]|nr:MerR family transcriptional regulator [Acidimicrobiaceae bacterium]HCV35353.1 MerR family transcriptional regulator [Acidimicrobiaceae bacterium]
MCRRTIREGWLVTTNVISEGYSSKRAVEIVGVTYRQLDYWTRTNLVVPALDVATGSGSRRRYDYRNLLELKAIKTLLEAGIRLEKVRDVFSYLSEHLNEDVTQVNLVISGTRSVAVMYEGEIIDLLRKGQSVLNILPLAGFKDELDSTIIELYPEGRATTGMPTATVAEG